MAWTTSERAEWSLARCVVTILIALIGSACCGRDDARHINYVVPGGFDGIFVLIQSPDGAAIEATGEFVLVEVPENGIMHVSSLDFLTGWHTETWRYSDGASIREIHTERDRAEIRPDEAVVRRLGSTFVNGFSVVAFAVGEMRRVEILEREWLSYEYREQLVPGRR